MPPVLQAAPWAIWSTCQAPVCLHEGSTQALTAGSDPFLRPPSTSPHPASQTLPTAQSCLCSFSGRQAGLILLSVSKPLPLQGLVFLPPPSHGPCRQVQSWKPMTGQHWLPCIRRALCWTQFSLNSSVLLMGLSMKGLSLVPASAI